MEESRTIPSITFTAAGSGRQLRLDDVPRTTVALIFGQDNANAVDPVVEAVRSRYPEEEVLIASIVDLSKMPKLIRKMAEGVMNGRYKAEAGKLRDGLDPVEHVVILPDWDGVVAKGLALDSVDRQLAVAVLAPGGGLSGIYQDANPQSVILDLLAPAVSQ